MKEPVTMSVRASWYSPAMELERLKLGACLPPDVDPGLVPYVLRSTAQREAKSGRIQLPDNWDGAVLDVKSELRRSMFSDEELLVASGYVLGVDLTSEEDQE